MRSSLSLLGLVVLAVLVTVFVDPRHDARAQPLDQLQLRPAPELRSMSLLYPWTGHLLRGMRLEDPEFVRHVDEYVEHDRFYGTWQLVQLVERAARSVSALLPGAKLSVGELSAQHGGSIVGHHSHRNGRDIDIGFYLHDEAGEPATAPTFVNMNRFGTGYYAGRKLRFDDARNWTLLAKLVNDDDARVQFVFVARSLQWRLLSYAKTIAAPEEVVARARAVMVQPKTGNRHQSHFHVRIYCPADDRPSCLDKAPYFPWYESLPTDLATNPSTTAADGSDGSGDADEVGTTDSADKASDAL